MEKREYHMKRIEDLTFTDDGMFQAVLHEPGICAELLERLLHVKVGRIEYPELEKTIAPFYSSKGVRLDVYLKDSEKVIDVEMQSYPLDEPGKRTRYYNSMVDIDCLMKGHDYSELKDCYILFICKQDPFRDEQDRPYGLPCYTFSNTCHEDSSVNLNDKTLKVFYNASVYEKVKDERVRALLRFIYTNECGEDDFSSRLSRIVEKLKESENFRSDYLAMNLHDRDITKRARQEGIELGIKQGISQGVSQKAMEAARNFFANGASIELIAKSLNMSESEIRELTKDIVPEMKKPQANSEL